jgi:hypothetical protein
LNQINNYKTLLNCEWIKYTITKHCWIVNESNKQLQNTAELWLNQINNYKTLLNCDWMSAFDDDSSWLFLLLNVTCPHSYWFDVEYPTSFHWEDEMMCDIPHHSVAVTKATECYAIELFWYIQYCYWFNGGMVLKTDRM